jgi:polyisoprenoid-binding protein YceI
METQVQQPAPVTLDTRTTWSIDPTHGTIGFSIKHLVVATVHGRFGVFQGTIRFDGDRPEAVEVRIDAASIDTGIARRDDHLRSADFFDVATYPAIAFRSTRVEPVGPLRRDRWRVVGDLTMHGVTRPVELAVERTDAGAHPWSAEVISFAATTQISRKNFGIGLDLPLEKGEFAIGDDVKLAIAVRALKRPIGGL